jgi:hypothetical protein
MIQKANSMNFKNDRAIRIEQVPGSSTNQILAQIHMHREGSASESLHLHACSQHARSLA